MQLFSILFWLLVKEEGNPRSRKHGPFPIFLRYVATNTFKITLIFLKITVVSYFTHICLVLLWTFMGLWDLWNSTFEFIVHFSLSPNFFGTGVVLQNNLKLNQMNKYCLFPSALHFSRATKRTCWHSFNDLLINKGDSFSVKRKWFLLTIVSCKDMYVITGT